jgi:hypothetical protein
MQPPLPISPPIDGYAASLEEYDADVLYQHYLDCEANRKGLVDWINAQ